MIDLRAPRHGGHLAGVRGRLISAAFARDVLPTLTAVDPTMPAIQRTIERWNAQRHAQLGPAASVRSIVDTAAIPLLTLLGYRIQQRHDIESSSHLIAETPDGVPLAVIVTPWASPLDTSWRSAVVAGVGTDARWSVCTNGVAWRIVDAQRTWARHFLEFDLDMVAHDADTLAAFWSLARAYAMTGSSPLLDRAVELSARHGVSVCRSLGAGVLEALTVIVQSLARRAPRGRRPTPLPPLFEQSLTVLYRVLFLLFAEARGLVPVWHPIYRDRYTIESIVTTLIGRGRYRGVWQALQAISRLAHAGCRAGELRVTAFNGRLFSPMHTPAAERGRIDDDAMGRAMLAVTTTTNAGQRGRARIAYRDLDVEQLGAVYEHVLDYEAVRETGAGHVPRIVLGRTGDLRKASGTFYTPRSLTDYLVRRTLAPLVRDRTADEILRLRVLDPAMGSGAFLVSACRYLASAAEAALVRAGDWHAADITMEDRITLRRDVGQRCLFGADLNPMAVQLGRLSLWLATLSGDRPLTFLDHHLVAGDSLVGATLDDVSRQPPGRRRGAGRVSLPLFARAGVNEVLQDVVATRERLATERDDRVEVVRRKESTLAALQTDGAGLSRWKAVLDLWCACWFWDPGDAPHAALFRELADTLLGATATLPPEIGRPWLDRAAAIAHDRRFLHWTLEFPEVFYDNAGSWRPDAGFDAVLGNPPWDMIRGDSGNAAQRRGRRADAHQLVGFAHGSGIYAADARSHVNRYQLFVERALQLTKPGGRIGLVLPSGVAVDAGSAPLRRYLFERAGVDSILGLDNRAGIFPIHRSVRFVLVTATTGRSTERIACRFGMSDPDRLDAFDDTSTAAFPVRMTRAFLSRVSGDDDLGIPELVTMSDVHILEAITANVPWLGSTAGWNVQFGRELNASDDRNAFVPVSGEPAARVVVEGKQIEPFRVALAGCRYELSRTAAARLRVPRRRRLAYRDVASATNRLTLIAAVIPARAVTTHTLFCLKTLLSPEHQLVLCALLNSYVANYLIRLRVNTHVTATLISRLPVPRVPEAYPAFARLATLARSLAESQVPVETVHEYAEAQGLAARLYGLTRTAFEHVLSTFPLVPEEVRREALRWFEEVEG
jgi:hypothetical protein